MNVNDKDLVIVRGINDDWFAENFSKLVIYFGGAPQAVPAEDAYYVGLYLEAPISKISHIGIVESIERGKDWANFNLKCIIKLDNQIDPGHPIRKHENWTLQRLKLNTVEIEKLKLIIKTI
ncbi:MAG: hypothetical protein PHW82_11250 [Bacteroidales bacterium]|nr:hypothetical protein [Bacteroidales bacterium]